MKNGLALLLASMAACFGADLPHLEAPLGGRKVFVLPIRTDIAKPLVYLVRRGVKEAMEAKADVVVIDMETNGGSVAATEEIIEILNRFPGETVSFVNKKAFSAGAFICFATGKIFMAPQSVIGAAAVVMATPGGGVQAMPDTLEIKAASAVSALVRANAEKHGHNVDVAEAMVRKNKELIIDGKLINEKGQILTLTAHEAEEKYGNPPQPLLSAGTVDDLDALLLKLGYPVAQRYEIKPTGAEKVGAWLNAISPVLLILGVIGVYIELKTPGFGLPGIVGIIAFGLYFAGGYAAGLSGWEWVVLFLVGLALVIVELFVYPGTLVVGLIGAGLVFVSLVMAMVDVYPGMPRVPGFSQLQGPLSNIMVAMVGAALVVWILSLFLPKTPLYRTIVSHSASGVQSEVAQEQVRRELQGQTGVALSVLRPSGKAQFGDQILDVVSQGDMVAKGAPVRIIGHTGSAALVEVILS